MRTGSTPSDFAAKEMRGRTDDVISVIFPVVNFVGRFLAGGRIACAFGSTGAAALSYPLDHKVLVYGRALVKSTSWSNQQRLVLRVLISAL